jgi:proteic killer suppression protein
MKIMSIRHRGVKRLYLQDDGKDLPGEYIVKITAMLTFICAMGDEAELKTIPSWKAHQLRGNRQGTWSLTVSGNWRLTLDIDNKRKEVSDIDFEDYH